MKELTLTYEQPRMKINGMVFDLQMSHYEIVKFGLAIIEKYKDKAGQELTLEQMQADMQEMSDLIDKALGPGATEKLVEGRPVSLSLIITWLASIIKAACEEYEEHAAK